MIVTQWTLVVVVRTTHSNCSCQWQYIYSIILHLSSAETEVHKKNWCSSSPPGGNQVDGLPPVTVPGQRSFVVEGSKKLSGRAGQKHSEISTFALQFLLIFWTLRSKIGRKTFRKLMSLQKFVLWSNSLQTSERMNKKMIIFNVLLTIKLIKFLWFFMNQRHKPPKYLLILYAFL